jgi:NitT/TauT family transport system permease protein
MFLKSFREEVSSGRLFNDIVASLWRVAVGFLLAAGLGVPAGLWLG